MKLNYKRTIYVGFAFFLILAFWQAYDTIIPLVLTNKFGLSQFWSGAVMALDNILALFLLPLLGTLSDKCKAKSGRRTPFIRTGTIIAVVLLVALSFADMAQLKNIHKVATVDDPTLSVIYDTQADKEIVRKNQMKATITEERFILSEEISREEFVNIKSVVTNENGKEVTNEDYLNWVIPARESYIREITGNNPAPLIFFVGVLFLLLIAMATFRSPAVALMPDVTPKPLRSKANAIINLLGYVGGIIVMVLGMVFATDAPKNAMMSYVGYFGTVAALMLVSLVIFLIKVKEPAWAKEMQDGAVHEETEVDSAEPVEKRKLTRGEKTSLFLILASVVLWFFGYNAVSTKFSVYASNVLSADFNLTMTVGTAAAIVSFVPVGILSSKIGRKKAILIGVALLCFAFILAQFVTVGTPSYLMFGIFILAGFAWATINVNSFPMVVELCSDGDVGKYTGYYYTASMAAQTLTPMVSGLLMDKLSMGVLFPYAALFVAASFVTMLFVKHGDSKPEAKKGLEALDIDD